MEKNIKSFWFRFLSIFSLLVPIGIVLCIIIYTKISPGINLIEIDKYMQNALNIKLEGSNSLASITIILLSGLWGFIFANIEKISIKICNNLFTLINGSISMVFSYICYRLALNKYFEILIDVKKIDLKSIIIQFWPTCQLIFFILGFIILFVFLIMTINKGGDS